MNRRGFLRSTGWVVAGVLMGPAMALGKTMSRTYSEQVGLARKLYREGEWAAAEVAYQELVTGWPGRIEGYDGLARLASRASNMTGKVEIYRQALGRNLDKPIFYERLSKSLQQVAMGHHQAEVKLEAEIGGPVLKEALYVAAMGLAVKPGHKGVQKRYGSIVNKAAVKVKHTVVGRARGADELPLEWKQRAGGLWTEPAPSTNGQDVPAEARLARTQKWKARPRRKLATEREEQLRRTQLAGLAEQELVAIFKADMNKYHHVILDWYKEHPEKHHLYDALKKFYSKRGQVKKVQELVRYHHQQTATDWSALGLASALSCRAGKGTGKAKELEEALVLYRTICEKDAAGHSQLGRTAALGYAGCLRRLGRAEEASAWLQNRLAALPEEDVQGRLQLLVNLGRVVEDLAGSGPAERFYLTMLGQPTGAAAGKKEETLLELARRKGGKLEKADIPTLHGLAAMYRRAGKKSDARRVYRAVLELQPKDALAARLA